MLMVLFDWEKAFDKIDRGSIFESMERLNIDPKIINIVKMLYQKTEFMVEMDGYQSEWKTQETGIRQGCPLSPYLFLVVMTVMSHDIHQELDGDLITHRIPGAEFDEVMYADDTICISTDTRTLNKFIAKIETEGKHVWTKTKQNKMRSNSQHPNSQSLL